MLSRFLAFIQPYVQHGWATGDDLGTNTELIDEALGELGVDGIGVEESDVWSPETICTMQGSGSGPCSRVSTAT
ncbi:hypothetical protein [Streptomyces mirabilis]|uniref:hypothetical protein n=1 Tax=Streptomyces mirabilis TaxID=68239 RepID=UPI0036DC5420